MTYSIIQPPFTLQFRDMSRKELAAYAAWFHDVTPARIAELANAVKDSSGYEGWEPDATPESLGELGRWFEGQVETRTKGAEELAEARAKLTFPIDVPEEQLTNRTFSLAMDIGMYFAQVVLKNLPGTRWDQPFGSKKFADYGQPVIMGFGAVPLNPVRVMVTTAYGISSKKPARLRELYDTWARMKR
ncbi:MAG TPA: hypothetical protein VFT22_23590 [Kofleriaceae bacterium]|nr:hypothetical protein [Kofleriaceae bacterium]